MAYRLPDPKYKNLYDFWGEKLANTMVTEDLIFNLSSVEYSSAILPYLTKTMVITPRFMTVDQKTVQPKFVVVHAKIARGAMASWIIKNRVEDAADLLHFNELGYHYELKLSTPDSPVFVAQQFGGIGLSVRLS